MIVRPLRLILTLLVLMSVASTTAMSRDRDPLAPIESMDAQQFEAFPEDIISSENAEAIVALVNEARLFGVPVAVRVIEMPTDHSALSGFDDIDLSAPIPTETMHELAQAWMEHEPIESSPGAADGFLMFVVMPEDTTLSSAVIETGPNALPLNGLTQENIDQIINAIVMPAFADNQISQGIRTGLSVFSYNNLFGEPERIAQDELHEDLQLFAGVPLAGITAMSGLALIGLAAWIHRRQPDSGPGQPDQRLSPFAAGALHEGRVSDAVTTGALLHLVRLGALVPAESGDFALRIDRNARQEMMDPFAGSVLDILSRHADADGVVHDAAARRVHDLMQPARAEMEDAMAHRGLFNRDGRAELIWLTLASGLVAVIALFTLLPSILGMARFGIFAIVFAILCIAGVLVWASRRSWTTAQGRAALRDWLETASIDERATFDTVVNQDALISAQGGPIVPATVNMVRNLRGVGAT